MYSLRITKTQVIGEKRERTLLVGGEIDYKGHSGSGYPVTAIPAEAKSGLKGVILGNALHALGFTLDDVTWLGRATVEDVASAIIGRTVEVEVVEEEGKLVFALDPTATCVESTDLPLLPFNRARLSEEDQQVSVDQAGELIEYVTTEGEVLLEPAFMKVSPLAEDTSQQAAEAAAKTAPAFREVVMRTFLDHPDGLTDDEGAKISGLEHRMWWARRRELVLKGLVRDSQVKRLSAAGRKRQEDAKERGDADWKDQGTHAIVWQAVPDSGRETPDPDGLKMAWLLAEKHRWKVARTLDTEARVTEQVVKCRGRLPSRRQAREAVT